MTVIYLVGMNYASRWIVVHGGGVYDSDGIFTSL